MKHFLPKKYYQEKDVMMGRWQQDKLRKRRKEVVVAAEEEAEVTAIKDTTAGSWGTRKVKGRGRAAPDDRMRQLTKTRRGKGQDGGSPVEGKGLSTRDVKG
ncbi:hypothetical protein RUM44_000655 [Polyplax serrata]|uniref:Uncharacterized protein n=1 Tax=Polyplax serrata TaxID=468196 RepID=A0ABR1B8A9_POLSC